MKTLTLSDLEEATVIVQGHPPLRVHGLVWSRHPSGQDGRIEVRFILAPQPAQRPELQPGDYVRTLHGGYVLVEPYSTFGQWQVRRTSDNGLTYLHGAHIRELYRAGKLLWANGD